MATPSPSFTPRLRMTRHSPIHYDQSQVASTSESGPSRLPDFSQLVDVNLYDMASDTTEQPTQSRISTTSTATRSDNPAAVLRALLSRLPNQSSSPRPQSSQQYPSERESDYEDQVSIDATPASRSQAQESLRDIFSKARRDSDTPRKGLQRRNSLGPNEAGRNSEANSDRSVQKGKQRSFSDDEFEQNSKTPLPNKAGKRSKTSPQPITKEFLRERFSNSYASPNGAPNEDSLQHAYNPSNESFLRELNTSEAIPTSTPQHSLRMSVNSQFHSNLLESDTEMQHAIEGLNSYGDESRERSLSPPPTIRRGPKTSSTTQLNSSPSGPNQDLDRTPLQSNTQHNSIRQESDSVPGMSYKVEHSTRAKSHNVINDYLDPHSHRTTSLSSMDLTSPLGGAEVFHHRSKNSDMLNDLQDESVGNRGPERSNLDIGASSSRSLNDYRHHSQHFEQQEASSPQKHSPSGSSLDLPNGSVAEQKNSQDSNLDSPHPSRLSRFGLRSSPRPYLPTNRSHDRHHEAADEGDFMEHMPSHPSYTRQELSPTSGRTSSLQAIDNTHLQRDSHQSGRSSTPLQSISKKRPASPSTSTISRKLKASPALTFNGERTGSPFSAKETPSRFMSRSPEEEPTRGFSSTPRSDQNLCKSRAELSRRTEDEQASETDELRDTDFSSRGGTPPIPPAQPDSYVEVSGSSSVDISQFPMPPSTPRTTSQDRTSFRQTSPERPATPSTPPQRPASRNTRREFRTPSPPQALPDLPTPSSSDESEDMSSRMQTTTPRSDPYARQDLTSLQTPRPPGGWAKTPKPKPKSATGSDLSDDGRYPDDNELHYPKTPSNLNNYPNGHTLDTIGKTPRPPGGWLATPASAPSASHEELSSQNAGLLTPMTSLSKGAGFDPKTPGVPGGWLTTPAARKSILKVRFDPREQTSQLSGHTTTETMDEVHNQTRQPTVSSPRNKNVPLPPSPRSPRKGKTAIRVVDAFGRKQTDPEADDKASRSMLRVVDALGREVQQSETPHSKDTTFDQEFKHSSRSELLAHIRQGLDNLATEFDDETMDDDLSASEVRIEELSRTSQNARLARKQLQAQSTSRPLVDLNSKQKLGIWANKRRFWLTLLLIQLVLLVLMFRISSHWAKQRYLTSFYDPFNPELYLYGSNFDYYSYVMEDAFSRTSWFSYARYRFSTSTGFWHDCLRFSYDIRSYLWNILTTEPPPRNGSAWLPT